MNYLIEQHKCSWKYAYLLKCTTFESVLCVFGQDKEIAGHKKVKSHLIAFFKLISMHEKVTERSTATKS